MRRRIASGYVACDWASDHGNPFTFRFVHAPDLGAERSGHAYARSYPDAAGPRGCDRPAGARARAFGSLALEPTVDHLVRAGSPRGGDRRGYRCSRYLGAPPARQGVAVVLKGPGHISIGRGVRLAGISALALLALGAACCAKP